MKLINLIKKLGVKRSDLAKSANISQAQLNNYVSEGREVNMNKLLTWLLDNIMMIDEGDSEELVYKGGQEPIIHLQADLNASVQWAQQQNHRWAFTLSNAGSRFFEDRNDLAQLNELDWQAIAATQWQNYKEGKQAEFLMEHSFPWHLIEAIVVKSPAIYQQVANILRTAAFKPTLTINSNWYY